MKKMSMEDGEAVVLAMLVMIGGSAFDVPGGVAHQLRKRFEEKFRSPISDRDIAEMIVKVKSLVTVSGEEDVIIE